MTKREKVPDFTKKDFSEKLNTILKMAHYSDQNPSSKLCLALNDAGRSVHDVEIGFFHNYYF